MQELPMIPNYMHRAFEAVYMADANQEKYEAFASRWKGLDAATFRHVIEVGEGKDKVVAIFALGYTKTPQAREAMLPLLNSPIQRERWASAFCLGEMRDERVWPSLQIILLEGLSLDPATWPQTQQEHWEENWYEFMQPEAVWLLEGCEELTLIPMMRQTFILVREMQRAGYPSYRFGYGYQDTLMYALGHRGAFGVLTGLDLPAPHRTMAMLYLALGHLQTKKGFYLEGDLADNEDLQQQVARVLVHRFGLTEEEQRDCVTNFKKNDYARVVYDKRYQETTEEDDDEEDDDEEDDEDDEEESIALRCPLRYSGHSAFVNSVVWSPGGRLIASGSNDTTAQVWQATTGKTIATFGGHTANVNIVAWSPDGRYVASGGSDSMVYVWNALTGEQVSAYAGHSYWILRGLCWSPDGTRIASGSWDGTVQVWDAFSGERLLVYRGHSGIVYSVAWSPDGKRIASGGGYPECLVKVWDAKTGETMLTYRGHTAEEAETIINRLGEAWTHGNSSVRDVAWSPDGTRLASAGYHGDTDIWEAVTGQKIVTVYYCHDEVAWSRDGTAFMSPASNYYVDVWHATTGSLIARYELADVIGVEHFGWSPDGTRLATTRGKVVEVWRMKKG
jgi:hypothetical protein